MSTTQWFSCTGVLIDFISVPVTVGFTSATSVIIATSQLKGLLGLKFESSGFLDTVRQVCLHLPEARVADSLLGLICITVLLLLRVSRRLYIFIFTVPNIQSYKQINDFFLGLDFLTNISATEVCFF